MGECDLSLFLDEKEILRSPQNAATFVDTNYLADPNAYGRRIHLGTSVQVGR